MGCSYVFKLVSSFEAEISKAPMKQKIHPESLSSGSIYPKPNSLTFRILTVLLLLLFNGTLFGQNDIFTGKPDVFIDELTAYFQKLSNKDDQQTASRQIQSFESIWTNELLEADQLAISEMAKESYSLKLKSHHSYLTLIRVVSFFRKSDATGNNMRMWLTHGLTKLRNKQLNEFEKLLTSSSQWMELQRIGGKGTITWYLRDAKWQFEMGNDSLFLLANGNLVAATKKDSSIIHQTEGKLLFAENKWKGSGGTLSWWRFGDSEKQATVTFSDYEIDLTVATYSADSVVLLHQAYFPFPVLGSFQDQVFNSPPGLKTNFPKFSSYRSDYEINDLFNDVEYFGGIIIEGASFIGKGDQNNSASVTFKKDKIDVVTLRSNIFAITHDRIQAEKAAMIIHLDNDSIFHPGVWFRFDQPKKSLTFLRSDKGIPDGPFINTYHSINMYAEAAYWQMDSDEVRFQQSQGLQTTSMVSAESADYFSMNEYEKLQGIDAENPLAAVYRYKEEMGITTEIQLGFLSEYLKKPPEQVAAQLLILASKGYLIYNSELEIAYLSERFDAVMGARSGKKDFDVIRFNSVTSSSVPNLILNIKNFDLQMKGIKEVLLSENQGVQLFPEKNEIVLKKNRDFVFSGLVKAGLFDFFARKASFEYEPFKLNFSFVDSLAFDVPSREQLPNETEVKYIRVKNVLADLSGTLTIDESFNKSGMKNLPKFPVFTSKNESYVYFDKYGIQNGELKRDKFFYVVDAFEIDSLDNFSTDNLRFDGYLTSAGIFPVFREPLTVMKDYSLGFEHSVPEKGYPMFENLATFFTSIQLSNRGFEGLGRLDYLTSTAYSKGFVFSPVRVKATTESYEMREKTTMVEYPKGSGTVLRLNWLIDSNQMVMETDTASYKIYETASFKGKFTVALSGMDGDGRLTFDNAVITSHYFQLKSQDFVADTADFRLMADVSNREAFMANDYLTSVDFRSRSATFNYIHQNSQLSFPFNQYICTLDEAFWDMDKKSIALNNNRINSLYDFSELSFKDLIGLNLSGSEFMSVHPAQDSLSFFCLKADYDLNKYLILAKDVKIIRVGDAAVFPSDSIVAIGKDAELKPVESAVIIADTSTMHHMFTDAKVTILSKNLLKAQGYYSYINSKGESTKILFDQIESNENGVTVASGVISKEVNFKLNPYFGFSGKVLLNSSQRYLQFNGGYQLFHSCLNEELPYVAFDTLVDPQNVRLPVKAQNTDIAGLPVRNGFYYASVTDSYFGAFLQNQRATSDNLLASQKGLVWYDVSSSSYRIEPAPEQNNRTFLKLETERCIVTGKSPLDMDLRLTNIDLQTVGSYTYKMIPDSLYLDIFASFNFLFDDKLLSLMADSINASGLPGGGGLEDFYLTAAKDQMNASDFERIANEVALYGAPRKVPEQFIKSLVFSHLKLKWNPATRSFVSIGPLNLTNIGKTQVNKAVNGFIEIEKTRSGDAFSIYLMLNSKQWFYFTYKSGIMQSLSSSDVFNTDLMSLKEEKRVVNDPEKGGRYEYTISTRRKMVDFLRKMQSLEF